MHLSLFSSSSAPHDMRRGEKSQKRKKTTKTLCRDEIVSIWIELKITKRHWLKKLLFERGNFSHEFTNYFYRSCVWIFCLFMRAVAKNSKIELTQQQQDETMDEEREIKILNFSTFIILFTFFCGAFGGEVAWICFQYFLCMFCHKSHTKKKVYLK